jgi:hypothetical protein
MPYIIECIAPYEHLAKDMAQMRTWLDHRGVTPVRFRALPGLPLGGSKLWIEFDDAVDANLFAQAFDGALLVGTPA